MTRIQNQIPGKWTIFLNRNEALRQIIKLQQQCRQYIPFSLSSCCSTVSADCASLSSNAGLKYKNHNSDSAITFSSTFQKLVTPTVSKYTWDLYRTCYWLFYDVSKVTEDFFTWFWLPTLANKCGESTDSGDCFTQWKCQG